MRPPRVIIGAAFITTAVLLTFLSLRSSHKSQTTVNSYTVAPRAGIRTLFSFRAPFSLFPPNAIITLTHENSTAFLARPATFGPSLPTAGLKGQVWIGSGFGDDSIRQGPVAAGAEGELGCSDVPGWVESFKKSGAAAPVGGKPTVGESVTVTTKSKTQRRGKEEDRDSRTADSEGSVHVEKSQNKPPVNDGTDDYLHHPLQGSTVTKTSNKQHIDSNGHHADIQSIQEGAEITGKVVLLSRGGCGFLEKVKWAQRRGAIALIVGDDRKGGALIQMYARGDTSNVTIPSIFTSRTTAHLLSSLIGPGSFLEDSIDENGKPTLKVQHTDRVKKPVKKIESGPTFTATTASTKATGVAARGSPKTPKNPKNTNKKPTAKAEEKGAVKAPESRGWFKSLFLGNHKSSSESESSRPPSSGQLDWVLVDDWKDDDSAGSKKISTQQKKGDVGKKPSQKAGSKPSSGDDFVIGVQDWRDPDLVGSSSSKDAENGVKAPPAKAGGKSDATKPKDEIPQPTKQSGKKQIGGALQAVPGPLRGGSITPGSGEYDTKKSPSDEKPEEKVAPEEPGSKPKGLLTTIFGDDEEDIELSMPSSHISTNGVGDDVSVGDEGGDDGIEGLWVTLTPTSGASPFLDTLLVLVVSPLVTLTVVYALLLVRSRIRRRRWRAPKSVVERLPVRTYQTIATPSPQTPRQPSPTSSSATTPLLQPSPPTRPRPRSRTTTGIPEPGDLIRVNSSPLQVPIAGPRTPEHEKLHGGESSEWRKFMGKQVECVVCLEEYVDGVSRVMSLPCGHEFHVDCITPWLTTRRRTCPICKGDVVRSLARGSPSSPRYEPYHDDSDDDTIQVQAAETNNTSSSSALPIAATLLDNEDLEQGIVSPTPTRPQRTDRTASWRSILSTSFGSTPRSPQPPQEDRDR
ncbi:putative E3 ubiquitin-protein ligase [Lachnellula occidentalis]|uniref:Putative E3 ubiquitin-protein ligase n=1 Tax=Lachnellula occidentalis TaxID=215460 RepID=A0A8H8UFU4_9HELO|nr:putative E3 ubiquitin-protein ligase [Lachnellula occidentalis]